MEPILDKAREGQGVLERIMNAIPGFKGYRDKELRRDSDAIQREFLATRLEQCKGALNEISAALTRSGSLDAMNDVETARKRLDKVVARIRFADRGYAPFFAPVKVDESILGRVYEFDMALIGGVDQVRAAAQAAGAATTDVAAAVRALVAEIDALDTRMNERETILSGIS
jgi:hypothetical protein